MQINNLYLAFKTTFFALAPALALLFFAESCKTKTNNTLVTIDFTGELSNLANKKEILIGDVNKIAKIDTAWFNLWYYSLMEGIKLPNTDSSKCFLLNNIIYPNKSIFTIIKKHYAKYPHLNESISAAFNSLHQALPTKPLPKVINYFSKFSNYTSIYVSLPDGPAVAYSAEMFLNDTFNLYNDESMQFEAFHKRYNSTEYIPVALVASYLNGIFEKQNLNKNMMENAIFYGKIWYTLKKIFKEKNEYFLYGYTEEDWKFLRENEKQIWNHLAENKILFNTDKNKYHRYFVEGDKTFGSGIPPECPPQIGNYIGLKIVEKYAENSGVSISELWNENSALKIYQKSGYNPLQ